MKSIEMAVVISQDDDEERFTKYGLDIKKPYQSNIGKLIIDGPTIINNTIIKHCCICS